METCEARTLAPDEYGLGIRPTQFEKGQICVICRKVVLSQYNPTKVCSGCTSKLQAAGLRADGVKLPTGYWAKYFLELPPRKAVKG